MGGDYTKFHVDRLNLAIHLLFVPVFAVAFALSILALAQGNLAESSRLIAVALFAFAFQAVGHKREPVPPEPFTGPVNFLQRKVAEQYFRFWRFLFQGDFVRAWRHRA
jgi:hypothetical protein